MIQYYSIFFNVQHVLFLLIVLVVVSNIGVNGSTATRTLSTSCTGFVSSTFLHKKTMNQNNLQQQQQHVATFHKSSIGQQQHPFIDKNRQQRKVARAAALAVTTFNNQEKGNDSESTSSTTSTKQQTIIQIVLTRELGKNNKLQKAIEKTIINGNKNNNNIQIKVIELPCIEHATGVDYNKLSTTIQTQYYDYIIITSPEAARVLIDVWPYFSTTNSSSLSENNNNNHNKNSTCNHIPIIAAVGTATEQVLTNSGLSVGFVPSKATGTTLVNELPFICTNQNNNNDNNICYVLYPASARAEETIQNGLQNNRNDGTFQVTRLNTYDTITSIWTKEQQELLIDNNQNNNIDNNIHTIVTFASPSSIKGWMLNTNNNNNIIIGKNNVTVACIGETSATACINKYNFNSDNIYYPLHQPGIDGWINSIQDAITTIIEKKSKHCNQ